MTASDQSATDDKTKRVGWEHFPHDADVGIRGFGPTKEAAFEQGALALMHVITDLDHVRPQTLVEISCEADKLDVLFVEWLNALIFEIATTKMLLSRFVVRIEDSKLIGHAWGEPIDHLRHDLIIEAKGATYTALRVEAETDGRWIAQCVVDV